MFFFILFLVIPFLEVAVFIKAGGYIGVGNTLLLTILTAIIGAILLRMQGFQTMQRAREKMRKNEAPLSELFDGICLFAAGLLLMTPGFITDSFGFLLFFPPFRKVLLKYVKSLPNTMVHGEFNSATFFHMEQEEQRKRDNSTVIDGEYTDITEEKDDKIKDLPKS